MKRRVVVLGLVVLAGGLVAAIGVSAATPSTGGDIGGGGAPAVQTSVQGQDDRVQVTDTTAWPRRASGFVDMTFADGTSRRCSGFTIEPDVIMTAAHCIYQNKWGGWANQSLKYFPGQKNRSLQPYYETNWTHIVTYKNWTDNQNWKYDMAIVQLDRPIGEVTGWKGRVAAAENHGLYTGWLNINQYPADQPRETMWWDANTTNSVTSSGHHISHKIDTSGGSSGSSIYVYYSGNNGCPGWANCPGRYTTGVHTYAGNFANRLTPDKYSDVEYMLNQILDKSLVDDRPDLVDDGQRWSSAASSTVAPGDPLSVSHDIRNIGTEKNVFDFEVEYYLVDGPKFSVDPEEPNIGSSAISLGTAYEASDIGPFRYEDVSASVTVPSSVSADEYYLCYEIDVNGNVTEFDETNNAACLDHDERVTVGSGSSTAFEASHGSAQFTMSGGSTTPGGSIAVDIAFENAGDTVRNADVQLDFSEPISLPGWSISDFGAIEDSAGNNYGDGDWFESDRYLVLENVPADETITTNFTLDVPSNATVGESYDYTPSFTSIDGNDVPPPNVTLAVEAASVDKSSLTYLEQIADSPWANKSVPGPQKGAQPPSMNVLPGQAQRGIAIDSGTMQAQTFSLPSGRSFAARHGDRGLAGGHGDVPAPTIDDEDATTGFDPLPNRSIGVDVDSDSATPGGEAVIQISANTTGSITIEGIPNDWTVLGSSDDGAVVAPSGAGDAVSSEGKATWAWGNDRASVSVAVRFGIPSTATTPDSVPLGVTAENGDGDTATAATQVTIQDCPRESVVCDYDPSGEIGTAEIQTAIQDFLTGNLDTAGIQSVINAFLNT